MAVVFASNLWQMLVRTATNAMQIKGQHDLFSVPHVVFSTLLAFLSAFKPEMIQSSILMLTVILQS